MEERKKMGRHEDIRKGMYGERLYRLFDQQTSDRKRIRKKYGYALLSNEDIRMIAEYSPIVEIGAGTGYLAHMLSQAGAEIDAYDISIPEENEYQFTSDFYYPVEVIDSVEFRDPEDRTLLISWPCYDRDWAYHYLKEFLDCGGEYLIYIGEDKCGCTATDSFFDLMNESTALIETVEIDHFYFVHDKLYIMRNNDTKGDND